MGLQRGIDDGTHGGSLWWRKGLQCLKMDERSREWLRIVGLVFNYVHNLMYLMQLLSLYTRDKRYHMSGFHCR